MINIPILNQYIKGIFIMGSFGIFCLTIQTAHIDSNNSLHVSGIAYASVQTDILSPASIPGIKEINGVKIKYNEESKSVYYFEYEANAQDTLRVIGSLPFAKDNNASSVACMLMNDNVNPLEPGITLSKEAREATAFFWDSKPEDFMFYECVKSPLKHTLLISKTSDRILHKVERI